VKLLGATTGATVAANPYYVGIVMYYLDSGYDQVTLAGLVLDVVLGPNQSKEAVVDLVYFNLLGVHPGAADVAYYSGLITGSITKAQFTVLAAEASYNLANIGFAGLGDTGIAFDPY
jgi:serralysin